MHISHNFEIMLLWFKQNTKNNFVLLISDARKEEEYEKNKRDEKNEKNCRH